MNPWAAIRAAFCAAIAARHAFHRSAGRPAAARSWLIRPHWPVPTATRGGAADVRVVGAWARAVATADWAEGVAVGEAIGRECSATPVVPMGRTAFDCATIECPSGADTATAAAKTKIATTTADLDTSGLINIANGRHLQCIRADVVNRGTPHTNRQSQTGAHTR